MHAWIQARYCLTSGAFKQNFKYFAFEAYTVDLHVLLYFWYFLAIKICGTSKDDCHQHATCTDTSPGKYSCVCNDGYTGDGKTCTGWKYTSYIELNLYSVTRILKLIFCISIEFQLNCNSELRSILSTLSGYIYIYINLL